jgi:hypothetical protein
MGNDLSIEARRTRTLTEDVTFWSVDDHMYLPSLAILGTAWFPS